VGRLRRPALHRHAPPVELYLAGRGLGVLSFGLRGVTEDMIRISVGIEQMTC